MKMICDKLKIEKLQTSPYHPSSNGMIERVNKAITQGLSHYVNKNQDNWYEYLPQILHAYRSTPTTAKGKSPHEMLFGQPMILPADIDYLPDEYIHTTPDDYVIHLQEKLKVTHDEADKIATKTREMMTKDNDPNFEPYQVGQKVWLKTTPKTGKNKKLSSKFTGPHEIIQFIHPTLYLLKTPIGQIFKYPVHHDRLKLHKGEIETTPTNDNNCQPITEEKWEIIQQDDDLTNDTVNEKEGTGTATPK